MGFYTRVPFKGLRVRNGFEVLFKGFTFRIP